MADQFDPDHDDLPSLDRLSLPGAAPIVAGTPDQDECDFGMITAFLSKHPHPGNGDTGCFYRCGRASARHREGVFRGWLCVIVFSLLMLPFLVRSIGSPSLGVVGSESDRAENALARGLPTLGREQMMLVFHSEKLAMTDPAYHSAVRTATLALLRQPGVTGIMPLPPPAAGHTAVRRAGTFQGLPYQDGRNSYAFVGIKGTDLELQDRFPGQRSAVQQAVRDASGGQISAYLVSRTSINYDLRQIEIADLRIVEAIAVVLAFLVLLVGLGSAGAAAVPLVMAGVTILVTLGIFGLVGQVVRFDAFLLTVISVVGLGVGIDYSLLVVSRYREELSLGARREDAAGRALATAGRTVCYSGLIAIVAASCLALVRISIFREFAVGAVLIVLVAMAAAFTLLPAVLVSCTPWLDRGRLPWRRDPYEADLSDEGTWARWAQRLMRRPWPYLVGVGVLLLVCAAPAMHLHLKSDIQRQSLAGTNSIEGLSLLDHDSFGGAAGTVAILIQRPRGTPVPDLTRLTSALRADPQVVSVTSVSGPGVTLVAAVPRATVDAKATTGLVRRIRGDIVPRAAPRGHTVLVGGGSAILVDGMDELVTKTRWAFAVILVVSFLLLLAIFRSLLLPLKAIAMNLLAVGTAYGLLILVFQYGLGERLFGFTNTGSIQVYLPLLIFAFLFGLSMDYEVFLIRRIQESYLATGDNTWAVAVGLQRTARPIFLAAAVMVAAFTGLLFSRILELKQFGFALIVAFAVDATLIRLVLVPCLMKILGRWNWWLPGAARSAR